MNTPAYELGATPLEAGLASPVVEAAHLEALAQAVEEPETDHPEGGNVRDGRGPISPELAELARQHGHEIHPGEIES